MINGIIFPYPDPIYCQHQLIPNSNSSLLLSYLPLSFLWSISTSSATLYNADNTNDHPICQRADLFAYEMTSFTSTVILGYIGFSTWNYHQKCHNPNILEQTPFGRIFNMNPSYLIEFEYIGLLNMIFQLWDFITSLYIREYCTPILLCHHIAASTASYIALRYQIFPYYTIFFAGCIEISNAPLVFIDLFKFFPTSTNDASFIIYENLTNQIAIPSFVLLFALHRVINWWPICYQGLNDIQDVTNIFKTYRPKCSILALWVVLILMVSLGLLQLYWFILIINEDIKIFV